MDDGRWLRIGPDRWRFVGKRERIEIGNCPHDIHRGHEWERPPGYGPGGAVCGICHPPPPAREEKQDG